MSNSHGASGALRMRWVTTHSFWNEAQQQNLAPCHLLWSIYWDLYRERGSLLSHGTKRRWSSRKLLSFGTHGGVRQGHPVGRQTLQKYHTFCMLSNNGLCADKFSAKSTEIHAGLYVDAVWTTYCVSAICTHSCQWIFECTDISSRNLHTLKTLQYQASRLLSTTSSLRV